MPLIHTCYRITDIDRSIAFYNARLDELASINRRTVARLWDWPAILLRDV